MQEESDRRWDAAMRRLDEQHEEIKEQGRRTDATLAALAELRDETNRKFEEARIASDKKFAEARIASDKRFEEALIASDKKFEEARIASDEKFEDMGAAWDRKFEEARIESAKEFAQMREELRQERMASEKKFQAHHEQLLNFRNRYEELSDLVEKTSRNVDRTMGRIGARWGITSEASFREGVKAILEKDFGVTVERVVEYDAEGVVHGTPEQVELDIIIRNGVMIFLEIKSTMSASDMHAFRRKIEYYEKAHGVKATRKMVISPEVVAYAFPVAEAAGIEVYGYPEEINPRRLLGPGPKKRKK
jgi:hypothetical protein